MMYDFVSKPKSTLNKSALEKIILKQHFCDVIYELFSTNAV